jgi:hypothetical protein
VRKLGGVAVVTVSLVLAGCSPSEPASTPFPDRPPAGCIAAEFADKQQVEGGAAVVAAVTRAEIPLTVNLKPGVQTTTSVTEPGLIDVTVGVCSSPLSEEELSGVADDIALALRSDPSSERIAVLAVSGWFPDAAGTLQQGESVTTEF